jgi:multiple sugar transport system permease protein/putative aldouronate transport system permease protein
MKTALSLKMFRGFNYMLLTILGLVMLYPFWNVLAASFSSGSAIVKGSITFFPREFTLENYEAVIKTPSLWKSAGVSIYITVLGTFLNLVFTSLMAFGLSRRDLKLRSTIMIFIIFTMIFQVPMVPGYLVVKSLGLMNTLWALMIPGLISAFNLIVMISFFQNLPHGLLEAAKIDGCSDFGTWWRIALPLSIPSITTIGLFYAVGHWNAYFNAIMFVRDASLYPLQVKLRQLLVETNSDEMRSTIALTLQSAEGIKMATIIVATVPILLIYPMIQRHFIKGAMLGSVKG